MDSDLFDSRLVVALMSISLGAFLTFIVQMIVKKRGVFTYTVLHNKVGMSAEDAVFGTVRVTWNDEFIHNLYLSTVELKNGTLKDYENVVVKVYTNNTKLLSERSELVGTTYGLKWTEDFVGSLGIQSGAKLTPEQWNHYHSQREYLLPTMNRGQVVRIAYLNAALTQNQPNLWVDIVHKGLKTRLRVPRNEIMGVSQLHALLVGSAIGFLVITSVIMFVDEVWLASVICMLYGLAVLLSGVVCIRAWRWLRNLLGS